MAQIGDILAKLGRREALTTAEQQQIRLWGNHTEIEQSFLSGLRNGQSALHVNSINSREIVIGRNFPGGGGAMIYYLGDVATGASYTNIPILSVFFNDFFSITGNTITFTKSGFYLVHSQLGAVPALTTGTAVLNFQGLSTLATFDTVRTPVSRYQSIDKGSEMYLQGKHSEAGTVELSSFIYFELIREYEAAVNT